MSKGKNNAPQVKEEKPVTPVADAAGVTENASEIPTIETATTDAPNADETQTVAPAEQKGKGGEKVDAKPAKETKVDTKPAKETKADTKPAKEETAEDKLSAKAKEVAKHYSKEKVFVVTEDGSVFLESEKGGAEFHAKQKGQKLFVYNVATATLKEA